MVIIKVQRPKYGIKGNPIPRFYLQMDPFTVDWPRFLSRLLQFQMACDQVADGIHLSRKLGDLLLQLLHSSFVRSFRRLSSSCSELFSSPAGHC